MTCNRKHCHRPRWRGYLNCRYHVLKARVDARFYKKRRRRSPGWADYLARKNAFNRIYQRKLRDRFNPDRRKVRCGHCGRRGHNLRTCQRPMKEIVAFVTARTLAGPRLHRPS